MAGTLAVEPVAVTFWPAVEQRVQKIDAEDTTDRGAVTIRVSSCCFTVRFYSIKLLKVQFWHVIFQSSPWLRKAVSDCAVSDCDVWRLIISFFFFFFCIGTVCKMRAWACHQDPDGPHSPAGLSMVLQWLCWSCLGAGAPHHSGWLESSILYQKPSSTRRIKEGNVWVREEWRTV